MERWDGVVEGYVAECQARGLCPARVKIIRRELERWGGWLKARRPRPRLEAIDADLVVRYLKERSLFKAKATLSGFVSVLRCAGEYLVRAGYWTSNPLRWLKGPKLDPFAQVPQRLDQQALTQLWQAVATLPNVLQRHQRLAQLALLYGLGLRRGELERLNVSDWNGAEGLVRVDGRKTGRERQLAAADFIARCVQGYLPHRQGAFGPAWLHVAAASAGLTAC